mgnify:CR=1 FL=1
MIIVCIEDCDHCDVYKELHPEFDIIQLPRKGVPSKGKTLELKKALFKLKFDCKFPALINDELTELTPKSELWSEIKGYYED